MTQTICRYTWNDNRVSHIAFAALSINTRSKVKWEIVYFAREILFSFPFAAIRKPNLQYNNTLSLAWNFCHSIFAMILKYVQSCNHSIRNLIALNFVARKCEAKQALYVGEKFLHTIALITLHIAIIGVILSANIYVLCIMYISDSGVNAAELKRSIQWKSMETNTFSSNWSIWYHSNALLLILSSGRLAFAKSTR